MRLRKSPRILVERFKQLQRTEYSIDALSLALIIFQMLSSVYFYTIDINILPGQQSVSEFMIILTLMGLSLKQITIGWQKPDLALTPTEVAKIFSTALIGFGLVALVQTIALESMGYAATLILSVTLPISLLLINISIAEETFFRYFLQPALEKHLLTTNPVTAWISSAIVTSLCFMGYHYVYSGNPGALMAVFLSSLILCGANYYTRRPSTAMIIHILVNVFPLFVAGTLLMAGVGI